MKVLAGILLAAALAACGDDGGAYCGNGVVEAPEQCDDENDNEEDFCRGCLVYLPPRTTLKWRFNAEAVEGFNQDGCIDTRTSTVRVELSGAADVSMDGTCSEFQVFFEELPPGPYTARVTPLDSSGNALVSAPIEQQVTAADTNSEHTINIPPEAWIGPYTGTYFFTLRWEGMGCAEAPVDSVRVTMRVGGTIVNQETEDGLRLNGSQPGSCVEPDRPSPQAALAVPFGLATIEVVGYRAGVVDYRGTFDTFVGAGPSNPTLEYDVPTVYDAMPPDAMPPDAM